MELRHLRVFVAVAEEGGFSRAAERLHVVQSAVSAGVRTLEEELGARLFDRNTRQVALSDAGRVLLPEARSVLAAAAFAVDSVAQVAVGLRGSVTLGTMQAQVMRAVSVPRILAAFRLDHPLVEVTLRHVGGSSEMARQVREGGLDLGLLSTTDERAAGLTLTPLASEPMLLACTSDHRLAHRNAIDLDEVTDESFVDLPRGWGVRTASDRAFAAAGQARTVTFEVNDAASVTEFVREGLAVALLPRSMTAHAPEVRLIPVRDQPIRFETFLAEPDERRSTAAAQALVETIRTLTRSSTETSISSTG
jgi:DNA-binding transcriptional LysR family regulator